MTAKHAICIIAHKNAEQINLLLKLLDHPLIDFYLHLDKKASKKMLILKSQSILK